MCAHGWSGAALAQRPNQAILRHAAAGKHAVPVQRLRNHQHVVPTQHSAPRAPNSCPTPESSVKPPSASRSVAYQRSRHQAIAEHAHLRGGKTLRTPTPASLPPRPLPAHHRCTAEGSQRSDLHRRRGGAAARGTSRLTIVRMCAWLSSAERASVASAWGFRKLSSSRKTRNGATRQCAARCVRQLQRDGRRSSSHRPEIPPTHRLQQVRPALQLTSSRRRRGLLNQPRLKRLPAHRLQCLLQKLAAVGGEPHRRERAGATHPPQRHRHHHRPCGHATGARTTRVRTVRARRAETNDPGRRPRPPGRRVGGPSWERRRGRVQTSVRCGARNQVTSEAAAAPAAKHACPQAAPHRPVLPRRLLSASGGAPGLQSTHAA